MLRTDPKINVGMTSQGDNRPEWRKKYDALIREQSERGIHPFSDDETLISTKNHFMEIFKMIPDEKSKFWIIRKPLFLETVVFKPNNPNEQLRFATPLSYIMHCGDYKALMEVNNYLRHDDYQNVGPHGSTLMHILISGFEKLNNEFPGPLECANFLLNEYPEMAIKKNIFGMEAYSYARHVLAHMKAIYNEILENGLKGWSGERFIILENGKTALEDDYKSRIPELEKLLELLKPHSFRDPAKNFAQSNEQTFGVKSLSNEEFEVLRKLLDAKAARDEELMSDLRKKIVRQFNDNDNTTKKANDIALKIFKKH